MVRKNKLGKISEKHYTVVHKRIKSVVQQEILRCFARDFSATETAKHVNIDVRTINPFYQWLRGIIAKHYTDFLRFRMHDIDLDLMVFLSHTAMTTMYWLNLDEAEQWDSHTLLLSGKAEYQEQSTDELMSYTFADESRKKRYSSHYQRNAYWLNDKFLQHRSKKLRTSMLDDPLHASETIYRFLITVHVLRHSELDSNIAKHVKGRFIGEAEDLQKVGVLNVDDMFEKYFVRQHLETISSIIFTDLIDWLTHHPDA